MTEILERLVPPEVAKQAILLPDQRTIVYPGNDAWLEIDPASVGSVPGSDPAWLPIEKYTIPSALPAKVMTVNASAQVDTAQSKFGGASAVFDGLGDYIGTPDHSDFALGSGDFTAECWLRFSDKTKVASIMGQWDSSASQMCWMFLWNGSNQLALATSVNGTTNVALGNWTWNPNNDQWYHVVIERSGNSVYMFIDGVAAAGVAFSSTLFNSTALLTIGGRSDVTTNTLAGWIDEMRFSVGIARYTPPSFTPQAAPFATDQYTKLLLHCDGTDGSNTFIDDSPMPPATIDPGSDPAWLQVER